MSQPVFISYARSSSRAAAVALFDLLGGDAEGLAFLDTSNVELGSQIGDRVVDAMLGARVTVILAEPNYFTRWYCLLELRVACAPFAQLAADSEMPQAARDEALQNVVVALPATGQADLSLLPPALQTAAWPSLSNVPEVAAFVRARLSATTRTLGQRLDAAGGAARLRQSILAENRLPPRGDLRRLPRVPAVLPSSLDRAYFGRGDDLWRLDQALVGQRGAGVPPSVVAIEGGAGTGKTRLVLEYIHRFAPRRFPGGVYWVDADVSQESLEERLHQILRSLDPSKPNLEFYKREGEASLRDDLRSVFEKLPADNPGLFIVDNVPEPDDVQRPLPLTQWCPVIDLVSTIATSRLHTSVGSRGATIPIALAPLETAAALALLTDGVDAGLLPEEDWRRLAEWVGGLPLALELLNRAMVGSAFEPRELLARAQDREATPALEDAMEGLRPHLAEGTLRGVTETILISYERLPEPAKIAAGVVAQFCPGVPIPEALLEALQNVAFTVRIDPPIRFTKDAQGNVTSSASAGETYAGLSVWSREVRATLVLRSWITLSTSKDLPTFGWMHRLVAEFLRNQSKGIAEEMQAAAAMDAVFWRFHPRQPSNWPLLDASVPHMLDLCGRLSRAKDPGRVGGAVKLALSIAEIRRREGIPSESRVMLERILPISREVLGETDPLTFSTMNNLGHVYIELGDDHAGARLLANLMHVRRRAAGNTDDGTLSTVGNLAGALENLGRLSLAIMLRRFVVRTFESQGGPQDPRTIWARDRLAGTVFQVDRQEGLRLQKLVLRARLRGQVGNEQDTFLALNNLGYMLSVVGSFGAARRCLQCAHAGRRDTLGPLHPIALQTMNALARVLLKLEHPAAARDLLDVDYEAARAKHGARSAVVMSMAWRLFQALELCGDRDRSEALAARDLDWLIDARQSDLDRNTREIREQLVAKRPGRR
jgi:hypothetical protein